MSAKSARKSKFQVPKEWSFRSPDVVSAFNHHVREQLPWYDIATGAVATVVRSYLPQNGNVIDVGCSTGNIGRAIEQTLAARRAKIWPFDSSPGMIADYRGPGIALLDSAEEYDFFAPHPDVIVCFLSLMFVRTGDRPIVFSRMKNALRPGGALIVVDKMQPRGGHVGAVNYHLTLAAKHEAGASPDEIMRKELSLCGLQRPLAESEIEAFAEFFRFGDFAGWIWEKQ